MPAAHVAAFREEMTTPRGNAPVAAPAATVGFAGEGVLRARNSERAGSASTS